jgi:nicotinamidase-related amidase
MSLVITPTTTALVLIDLQKGTLSMPLAPHTTAQVIERAASLGHALAKAGGTIVKVNVAFAGTFADRLSQPVDAPMQLRPGSMPADYSSFAPEIESLPSDVVITKRQWGAFYGTELDLQLRRRGISTIVLCGIATNFGVESTAREAWQHNYAVIIAEDACSSVADLHQFSIEKIMPRIARVRSTAEILAAIERR